MKQSIAVSAPPAVEERGIRLRDVMIFLAISNFHYPLFMLAGLHISPSILPIPIALIMTAALMAGRLSTIMFVIPYIVLAGLYFIGLGLLGVGFGGESAYVTTMQTATVIAFLLYLLSMGPAGAREVINNLQKLLGGYIVLFSLVVVRIILSGDSNMFNQVAQSNYLGLLTTYFILAVFERAWTSTRSNALVGLSTFECLLGQQRASFVINACVVGARYVLARKGRILFVLTLLVVVYVVYASQIKSLFASFGNMLDSYYVLAALPARDLENLIVRSAAPGGGPYDASALARLFSAVYVGREVVANPMTPIVAGEYANLYNSHNLFLEYFKVGGLLFFTLSVVALFKPFRALIRRRYFRLSPLGVMLAFGYALMSNDLFIGFFLLPLAFPLRPQPAPVPLVLTRGSSGIKRRRAARPAPAL